MNIDQDLVGARENLLIYSENLLRNYDIAPGLAHETYRFLEERVGEETGYGAPVPPSHLQIEEAFELLEENSDPVRAADKALEEYPVRTGKNYFINSALKSDIERR